MRIVLMTTHLGNIGGGENYLMRLAMALDKCSDFYVHRNWGRDFITNNGFGKEFKVYDGLFKPDVLIYSSHFQPYPPFGNRNVVACFFPKIEVKPAGYDLAIALNDFVAEHVQTNWGIPTIVIEPCVDPSLYTSVEKLKKIVTIGHFFEEVDGHSKNQHILSAAFEQLEDFELVHIGNATPGDQAYVRKLKKFTGKKNIRCEINRDSAFIKGELASASHLWHANGYGRENPAQTEHFGIIALEALASGVVPIVHNSGGCSQIDGVVTWELPTELPALTLGTAPASRLAERYTVEHFEKEVQKWVESERSTLDAETTTEKAPTK